MGILMHRLTDRQTPQIDTKLAFLRGRSAHQFHALHLKYGRPCLSQGRLFEYGG